MKTDVSIKLQVYIKLSNEKYFVNDALLLCEGSEYKIVANIDSKDAPKFSFRSKYWNDHMLSLKLHQEFNVKKAYLDNREIKVRFNYSRLTGLYGEHYLHKNYTTFVWKIDSFVYEVENVNSVAENDVVYCLTRNANEIFENGEKNISFQYRGLDLSLFIDRNENVGLKCSMRQDFIVDEILMLMSFYLRTPIECRMIHSSNTNMVKNEYRKMKYNIIEKHIVHFQFMYLDMEEINTFINFIDAINRNEIEGAVFSCILKGIDTYVRSNYLDNLSKYIQLYSVLAVFANKIHDFQGNNEYKRIKCLFEEFNINISLLDNGISRKNWIDSNGESINNFAELRNEIMHSLPSQDIIDFLDNESIVVSCLEFIVSVIILKELGLLNVKFIEGYGVNVFNQDTENNN